MGRVVEEKAQSNHLWRVPLYRCATDLGQDRR